MKKQLRLSPYSKKIRFLILFSLFIIISSFSFGQIKEGQIKVGGSGLDLCNGMAKTSDGGFIMAGWTDSYGQGGGDVYVIKLDSNANLTWAKTLGGTQNDGGGSVIQTSDGGYAINAWSHSYGSGSSSSNWWDYNIYVVKLKPNGFPDWTETISDTGWSDPGGIVESTDKGLVILGSALAVPGDSSDICITKLDSSGNIKWNTNIGGTGDDEPGFITTTNDGGYAITGYTNSFGLGSYDVYVIKVDSLGNVQWTETMGGSGNDYGECIIQTTDGGYAISGETLSFGDTVNGDVYVIKLNNAGHIMWTKTIGGSGADGAQQIIQTKNGGYAIAAQTYSYGGNPSGDVYAIKLDSSGNLQWTRAIGGVGEDYANSVVQTRDGGYAFGGGYNFGSDGKAYFVKLDSMGNNCTVADSGGLVSSGGVITTVDSGRISHRVKITSTNEGVLGSGGVRTDVCTVVSVDNIKAQGNNVEVYPNPSSTQVTFKISSGENTYLKILDVTGREIETLPVLNNEIQVNISAFSSGIYFYEILDKSNTIVDRGKFSVVK